MVDLNHLELGLEVFIEVRFKTRGLADVVSQSLLSYLELLGIRYDLKSGKFLQNTENDLEPFLRTFSQRAFDSTTI